MNEVEIKKVMNELCKNGGGAVLLHSKDEKQMICINGNAFEIKKGIASLIRKIADIEKEEFLEVALELNLINSMYEATTIQETSSKDLGGRRWQ